MSPTVISRLRIPEICEVFSGGRSGRQEGESRWEEVSEAQRSRFSMWSSKAAVSVPAKGTIAFSMCGTDRFAIFRLFPDWIYPMTAAALRGPTGIGTGTSISSFPTARRHGCGFSEMTSQGGTDSSPSGSRERSAIAMRSGPGSTSTWAVRRIYPSPRPFAPETDSFPNRPSGFTSGWAATPAR